MLIIIFIIIVVESTSGTEVDNKLPSALNQENGVEVLPATTFEKRHLGNIMNYETVQIVLNIHVFECDV